MVVRPNNTSGWAKRLESGQVFVVGLALVVRQCRAQGLGATSLVTAIPELAASGDREAGPGHGCPANTKAAKIKTPGAPANFKMMSPGTEKTKPETVPNKVRRAFKVANSTVTGLSGGRPMPSAARSSGSGGKPKASPCQNVGTAGGPSGSIWPGRRLMAPAATISGTRAPRVTK